MGAGHPHPSWKRTRRGKARGSSLLENPLSHGVPGYVLLFVMGSRRRGAGFEVWKQEAERRHVWAVGPLGGGVPDGLPGLQPHDRCRAPLTGSKALGASSWSVSLITMLCAQNSAHTYVALN